MIREALTMGLAGIFYVAGYGTAMPRPQPEPADERIIVEEVERAANPRVTVALVRALYQHESAGGRKLSRFEERKLREGDPTTVLERVAMATSHGPLHVMGSTAKAFGFDWKDIQASRRLGIRAGIKVLADCVEREETLFSALRCYNGGAGWRKSDADAQAMTARYANTVALLVAEAGYNAKPKVKR